MNENDTVAVQELRIGDNDTLSAQVGTVLGIPRMPWAATLLTARLRMPLVGAGRRRWVPSRHTTCLPWFQQAVWCCDPIAGPARAMLAQAV